MVLCAQAKNRLFSFTTPCCSTDTNTCAIVQISSKDNSRGTSRSTKPTSNSANIFLLSAEFSVECAAGDCMSGVLWSVLNGRWFKMKSGKRCEVNEFYTPVSLKTQFWLNSHSDWGWRAGNCAMQILLSRKRRVAVSDQPQACLHSGDGGMFTSCNIMRLSFSL